MEKFKSIGLKQSFVDAREKVTGSARYLDDLEFPGLLFGKYCARLILTRGYCRSIPPPPKRCLA